MSRSMTLGDSESIQEFSLMQKIPLSFFNLDDEDMVSIVVVWENGAELSFCDKQKHKTHNLPYKVIRHDHQSFSVTFYCKGLCSSKKPGQMKIIASVLTKEKAIVSLQSSNFLLRGKFALQLINSI